jgi:hypothetical protein
MHPTNAFGRLFAAAFAGVKLFRPHRPIHPKGVLFTGMLEKTGEGTSGIAWLDEPGTAPVTARLSRSLGFPAACPDIIGLALRVQTGRVQTGSGEADILLASTGWNVPARFALLMHRTPGRARLTFLMPYRGNRGPVLLGARTTGADPGSPGTVAAGADWTLDLFHTRPTGQWTRFGALHLTSAGSRVPASSVSPGGQAADTDLRFDPLLNVLPGADIYGWTWRLREHSYRLARR